MGRYSKNKDVLKQPEEYLPANITMLAACHELEKTMDCGNIKKKVGLRAWERGVDCKKGGALTSCLLKRLYAHHDQLEELGKRKAPNLTYPGLLKDLRLMVKDAGLKHIPQMTSSRPIQDDTKFRIIPKHFNDKKNKRKALIIGINYKGQQWEIPGCQNDCINVMKYLRDFQGFRSGEFTLLLDDGKYNAPTKRNLLLSIHRFALSLEPGDVGYVHFSGHGITTPGKHGCAMVPVDYVGSGNGEIPDNELFRLLLLPLKKGVNLTVVMDCCHSGSLLDLPFDYEKGGPDFVHSRYVEMERRRIQGLQAAQLPSKDLEEMLLITPKTWKERSLGENDDNVEQCRPRSFSLDRNKRTSSSSLRLSSFRFPPRKQNSTSSNDDQDSSERTSSVLSRASSFGFPSRKETTGSKKESRRLILRSSSFSFPSRKQISASCDDDRDSTTTSNRREMQWRAEKAKEMRDTFLKKGGGSHIEHHGVYDKVEDKQKEKLPLRARSFILSRSAKAPEEKKKAAKKRCKSAGPSKKNNAKKPNEKTEPIKRKKTSKKKSTSTEPSKSNARGRSKTRGRSKSKDKNSSNTPRRSKSLCLDSSTKTKTKGPKSTMSLCSSSASKKSLKKPKSSNSLGSTLSPAMKSPIQTKSSVNSSPKYDNPPFKSPLRRGKKKDILSAQSEHGTTSTSRPLANNTLSSVPETPRKHKSGSFSSSTPLKHKPRSLSVSTPLKQKAGSFIVSTPLKHKPGTLSSTTPKKHKPGERTGNPEHQSYPPFHAYSTEAQTRNSVEAHSQKSTHPKRFA